MKRLCLLLTLTSLVGSFGIAAQKPLQDTRGTEQQPLIIQTLPAQESAPSPEEIKHDEQHSVEREQDVSYREKDANRREWTDRLTLALGVSTAIILIVQAVAFFKQAAQLRLSVRR
jgi:hypothetical protein